MWGEEVKLLIFHTVRTGRRAHLAFMGEIRNAGNRENNIKMYL
jgi:hypothetical protein